MNAAELSGVTVLCGGEKLLDSVSLAVPEGELWVLAGRALACSHAALRVMAGRARPDLGTALVFGRPAHEIRRELGFVACGQSSSATLLRAMPRVRAALRCRAGAGAPSRSARVLDALGMDFAQNPIGELSRLERRKTIIAAALLGEPTLLCIADPLVDLGPAEQRELANGLAAAREAARTTIVCSSARLAGFEPIADAFAVFDGPSLAEVARSSQLRLGVGERRLLRTADLARDFVILSREMPGARLSVEYDAAEKSRSIRIEGADELTLGEALKRAGAVVLELRSLPLSIDERLGLA
ncbi:ATP-binding cassette domain-containing protein [Paratractidigestivibacter sp.]|uniref:ATP-binding cassette domain-containing protein n=1 Tax=Paratractidigestivibacter sp. TaxID=2847316 RepID=UPI002ABE6545|nr:ATP-binding cassette domain-containing protein [Paratractidigestivibacter sp.]